MTVFLEGARAENPRGNDAESPCWCRPGACYDEGKRVAETMMYSYQRQVGVEVRVARIFNTFGRRMHPNDGRVVSNFIIQALQNKDITQRRGAATRGFYFNVPPGTRTRVAQFRRTSPPIALESAETICP